jgi:hypothetical protein
VENLFYKVYKNFINLSVYIVCVGSVKKVTCLKGIMNGESATAQYKHCKMAAKFLLADTCVAAAHASGFTHFS